MNRIKGLCSNSLSYAVDSLLSLQFVSCLIVAKGLCPVGRKGVSTHNVIAPSWAALSKIFFSLFCLLIDALQLNRKKPASHNFFFMDALVLILTQNRR